jgi:hypothetical protein
MGNDKRHYYSAPLTLAGVVCVCALAGCGRGPATAHVSGRVNFKNGQLPAAGVRMIRFEPAADSPAPIRKGASGTINDDGTFELYTRRPGDGVYLGKYAVTFAFYRGAMDQRPLIAPKYAAAATTPYQVAIDDDVDDLNFDLETLAAQPPTTPK